MTRECYESIREANILLKEAKGILRDTCSLYADALGASLRQMEEDEDLLDRLDEIRGELQILIYEVERIYPEEDAGEEENE